MSLVEIKLWSKDELEKLVELVEQGKTNKEISAAIGRPMGSISSKMKAINLKRCKIKSKENYMKGQRAREEDKKSRGNTNRFTKEEDEKIIKLRAQGLTYQKIEDVMPGRMRQTIRHRHEWLTKRKEINEKARIEYAKKNRDEIFTKAMNGRLFEDVPEKIVIVAKHKRLPRHKNAYGF